MKIFEITKERRADARFILQLVFGICIALPISIGIVIGFVHVSINYREEITTVMNSVVTVGGVALFMYLMWMAFGPIKKGNDNV